jgi:hypothetical protein
MLLWFVFGLVSYWPIGGGVGVPIRLIGGDFLLFILLLIIGLQVFGSPIKR